MRFPSLPQLTRLAALVSVTALFGPPHIKVRHVATPATAATGVVFELDVLHHSTPEDSKVTGRAEGVRDGTRVSVPLTIGHKSTGLFTVTRQWDAGKAWVLVFSVEQGPDGKHGVAEAVVSVEATGAVRDISYTTPGFFEGKPVRATTKQVDAALKELGLVASAPK